MGSCLKHIERRAEHKAEPNLPARRDTRNHRGHPDAITAMGLNVLLRSALKKKSLQCGRLVTLYSTARLITRVENPRNAWRGLLLQRRKVIKRGIMCSSAIHYGDELRSGELTALQIWQHKCPSCMTHRNVHNRAGNIWSSHKGSSHSGHHGQDTVH